MRSLVSLVAIGILWLALEVIYYGIAVPFGEGSTEE